MAVAEIFLLYVCPSLGGIMSTVMFAAPVNDLRAALVAGSLGDLNPYVFAAMTGNTLGWLIYGYFLRDPFLVASNLPGFILSIYLNSGAAKLQYLELKEQQKSSVAETHQVMQRWDADRVSNQEGAGSVRRRTQQQPSLQPDEEEFEANANGGLEMTPQEALLLRVLVFWAVILIYTSWLYPHSGDPANLVGILVNINLIVFYAAPLKTIQTVISQRNSASIHYETMVMNWINTSFWIGYGCARRDLVIVVPNGTGLLLGIAQGVLCLLYPRLPQHGAAARLSLHELESDLLQQPQQNPEDPIPETETAAEAGAGGDDKSQGSANTPEIV